MSFTITVTSLLVTTILFYQLISIKTNPKCFYGYVTKKAKIKSGIGPLRKEANDIVDDPQ